MKKKLKIVCAMDEAGFSGNPSRKVAIQGEAGSNSHMAALQALGAGIALAPCSFSAEVFEQLASANAAVAVLPIENSLHGSVAEHYDLLLEYPVKIVGETALRIRHNVVTMPGVELAEIRRVVSHPVALSQCRRWLRAHPEIAVVPGYDTAGSVKDLMAAGDRTTAGLAPELAAREYGAAVLINGIEDHAENYTRFYVLESDSSASEPDRANKMSVAFTLEHRPGALVEVLAHFVLASVNLTRIESRPVPGKPWEYVFFADLRFTDRGRLEEALTQVRMVCREVQVLGVYCAAEGL